MSHTSDKLQPLIKQRCVGLTGGIATGKSTVASILRDLGYMVFDADLIARDIVRPGKPALMEIVKEFGPDVLSADGLLDRKKMGSMIWNQPEKKARLEAITHPNIKAEFLQQLAAAQSLIDGNLFFYEAALLFEVGRDKEFYKILATYCPLDEQIRRLTARNQLSEAQARDMIAAQMPAETKRDLADVSIDTDCELSDLKQRVLSSIKVLEN